MRPKLVLKVKGGITRLPLGRIGSGRNEGLENTRAWRAMIAEVAADDSTRKLRQALMEARLRGEPEGGSD
jgi:hypothetical protein